MIILGLTGSIGMGKSTAAHMLRELNVPVHCSDEAVHRLLGFGGAGVAAVARLCPEALIKKGRQKGIDRKILGAAAFHDEKLMKKLERILHPKVRKSEADFVKAMRKKGERLVVLDIPLLFETGAQTRVHGVMVVSAPRDIQKKRVLARPHMTSAKFRAILKKQMSDAQKRKKADIIIDTGHGLARTRAQLRKVVKELGRGR